MLSPAFFAKEWPQRELDALFAAEIAGRSRILPIWHQVDSAFMASVAPLLADRRAALSSYGIDHVIAEIIGQFPASALFTGAELALVLERFPQTGFFSSEALAAGCRFRFLLMNAYKEECCRILDAATSELSEAELEVFPSELEQKLKIECEKLRIRHGLPENVYLESDEPIREDHLDSYLRDIAGWVSGTLTPEDAALLIRDLDNDELDEYFILLGLPNFSFSEAQRSLLEEALIAIGSGLKDGYAEVHDLSNKLRELA